MPGQRRNKGRGRASHVPAPNGVPIQCAVRVHAKPGSKRRGDRQRQDIELGRSSVTLLRPGASAPDPDDEYNVDYSYGEEAGNEDVYDRTIEPLVERLVAGHNVTVLLFGATGTGKTSSLEGVKGGAGAGHEEGLIPLAISGLYRALEDKTVEVGEEVAVKRRAAAFRGMEYAVECRYVEIHNEECFDLLASGDGVQVDVEDSEDAGWYVRGASVRPARDEAAMLKAFQAARARRTSALSDLGAAHTRSTAIFTLQVMQYLPYSTEGIVGGAARALDATLVSQAHFVDTPGAEALAMEPEILRLREGPSLNRAILALGQVVQALASPATAYKAHHGESMLTKLLFEALGGNCHTCVVATLAMGEWAQNKNTMRYAAALQAVHNFPVVNDDCARGVLQRAYRRTSAAGAQAAALREHLASLPPGSDPAKIGAQLAQLHDLEGQVIGEREAKAALQEEKDVLLRRLKEMQGADRDLLSEKEDLQAQLIQSEEDRLQVTQELLDLQEELLAMREEHEDRAYELEQKLIQLEAEKLEWGIKHEAAQTQAGDLQLQAEELGLDRDRLQDQLKAVEQDLQAQLSAARSRIEELEQERQDAAAAGEEAKAEAEEARAEVEDGQRKMEEQREALERAAAEERGSLQGEHEQARQAMQEDQEKLHEEVEQQRRIAEEAIAASTKAAAEQKAAEAALKAAREEFKKKLAEHARKVADVVRAQSIQEADPESKLLDVKQLPDQVEELLSDYTSVQAAEEREHHAAVDRLHDERDASARKAQNLYNGYRSLRHRLGEAGGADPVPHEDQIAESGAAARPAEEEGEEDRGFVTALKEKVAALERELKLVRSLHKHSLEAQGGAEEGGNADVDKQQLVSENSELQLELDRARRDVHELQGQLRAERELASAGGRWDLPSAPAPAPSTPGEWAAGWEGRGGAQGPRGGGDDERVKRLEAEKSRLEERVKALEEEDRTRAALSRELAEAKREAAAARREVSRLEGTRKELGHKEQLRRQMREFTENTQKELEEEKTMFQARAVAAEEQLEELQQYMTKTTVAYQKEIMRLREIVGQYAPDALKQPRNKNPPTPPEQGRGDSRGEAGRPSRSAHDDRGPANDNPVGAWNGR